MTTQKPNFDTEAALKAMREGKDLTGKDGVPTPLVKQLTIHFPDQLDDYINL